MFIIKELRRQRKISQQCLANEIGVSLRTIQYYEKGDIDISVKKLQKICDFFEVSIFEVLKRHEANEGPPKYKLITEIEEKFEIIHIEDLIRYIITHENEFMKNKTFRMWVENRVHHSMTKFYYDEFKKLLENKD